MAYNEFYDAMVPINLENGKTIWTKIGTAFPNNKPDKKHKMVLSITSLPLNMFTKDEIKIFIFPQRERRPQQNFEPYPPSTDNDDVPF